MFVVPEARLGSFLADAKQSLVALIQLVHQGQVVMPPPMLNLVDTDRLDSTELSMCNSPVNYPLDRSINAIPACRENSCCLLPTQTLGPGCQK